MRILHHDPAKSLIGDEFRASRHAEYTWLISRRPRHVSEADVCRYLAANHDIVREQAKNYICNEIDNLTLDELFDVFWQGRKDYGGEFDVESIPCVAELKKEAADTIWYVNFLRAQREH